MEWLDLIRQFGDGPFKFAVLGAILHGVRELSKMRKSVEKLNIGMAVIVEKVHSHGKRISSLEGKKK